MNLERPLTGTTQSNLGVIREEVTDGEVEISIN